MNHDNWRYQVRKWRDDGCRRELVIVPNGCTDSVDHAFNIMADNPGSHIRDCQSNEIIANNYNY